jgi:UDP-N-acetylmuramoyl-L-alanyl-D-glutamate--2,6-diaminopimelate ligase
MGEVAETLADRVIVTDDNPRREDGDAIVAQILAGLREPARATVERNRARAIAAAIAGAAAGDIVLVAGKGHEDYQQVGDLRLPFSDRAVVQGLLGGEAAA